MKMTKKLFWTLKEVATIVFNNNISVSKLGQMVAKNEIEGHRIGRKIFVTDHWVKQQMAMATGKSLGDLEKEEIKLKKQKKIEFSKIILIGVTMAVTIVTLFSFAMIYVTRDLSPLSYLIPAWFTEFSIATGFYYNKAKAENITSLITL